MKRKTRGGAVFLCLWISMSFLPAPPLRAAIVPAASCSQADVQAAIDLARDGDTVLVPAGTCTWTQTVRMINKSILLQGAGMDRTVITDMTGNAWDQPALWIEVRLGQHIRVTGIAFLYGQNATLQDYNGAIVVRGTCREVRIDHCRFVDFWNRSLSISGFTYGLIDHCLFQRTPQAVNGFQAINVSGDSHAAWERPLSLGSANAFYIEDNTFDFHNSGSASDSHSGGRFVFRMNALRNGHMLNHGLDTTDRSSHSFEIYDNTFLQEASLFNIITIRGGTGVIYRNAITSPHSINIPIIAQYYRSCVDYPGTHGLRCNGTNPIDGNQDETGYPCKDQHGRTTGQVLSPIYLWENTLNSSAVDMQIYDPWHCANPSMSDHLKEGRDFHNDVFRPDYVPYPYPHPLTLADSPGEQRALDLQGNMISGLAELRWQAVNGAVNYRIVRDWEESSPIVVAVTNYGEVMADDEHVYMVYALDGEGKIIAAEGRFIERGATQTIPFNSGWNWISFNVLPGDRSLDAIFAGILGQVEQLKAQARSVLRSGGGWIGDLPDMDGIQRGEMYKVKVSAACTLTAMGNRIAAGTPIPLDAGWNWVAFYPEAPLPIAQALASIQGQVLEVKSRTQSATFDGTAWSGALTQLVPGEGYAIRVSGPVNLTYSE